jgi:hypothetical protein
MFIKNKTTINVDNYKALLDPMDAQSKSGKLSDFVVREKGGSLCVVKLSVIGKLLLRIANVFHKKVQFVNWASKGKVITVTDARTEMQNKTHSVAGKVLSLPDSTKTSPVKMVTEKENISEDVNKSPTSPTAKEPYIPELYKLGLKPLPAKYKFIFGEVKSAYPSYAKGITSRDLVLKDPNYKTRPPILSKSEFVPDSMVEHLMRDKKSTAIGVKYDESDNDAITNMEGAMHTFLTPVVKINMTGDYKWGPGHSVADLGGLIRPVIMSAAIHPDFELGGDSEVVMRLVEVKSDAIPGKELPKDFVPLSKRLDPKSAEFKNARHEYDNDLCAHMIYHLTQAHKLPSVKTVPMDLSEAMSQLDSMIISGSIKDISSALVEKTVSLNGHVISLEALYNIYLNMARNEFSVLEGTFPLGYVYTIDPPSIFAVQIGSAKNVSLLNRLQILALKEINATTPLQNLKVIGFNDYMDKGAVPLYKAVFPNKEVVSKSTLFSGQNGEYSRDDGYALIEHNNSDGFGQNIEFEGMSSKDGVLGCCSDAAHSLRRDRPDLISCVF